MAAITGKLPEVSQRRPRVRKSIAHVPSSELDQENSGQTNATIDLTSSIRSNAGSKKSRSKSLGPGGLDALKEASGNRRRSAATSLQPKSILKPTIPLSPIRAIPARKTTQGRGQARSASASPKKESSAANNESVPDTPARAKDDALEKITEEPPAVEAETAEDSEAAERRKRKAEIQKQRDARRKSMAGRRVSFAPEATLHTWDTEVLQDSTTSTGSADSTRRASSFANSNGTEAERPGTPPDQVEEDLPKKSPEHQRDAHKKGRRRSSGVPPMNFNDPDTLSSSPFSGSSVAGDDQDATYDGAGLSPSPRKGEDATLDDATMESIDEGTKGDEDLDASLEDAAKRAGTRTLDLDENGDVSMDIAGDEVTAAFKPWVKQSMGTGSPHPGRAVARMDQENLNIFTAAEAAERGSPTPSHGGEEEMSMDMTQAMGGIMRGRAANDSSPGERYPKRRKSVAQRRRSSGAGSELSDGTMDLTTAVGGVQPGSNLADLDPNMIDEKEELSMEFTSVFDGVKSGKSPTKNVAGVRQADSSNTQRQAASQADDNDDEDDDGDMEMTEAVGSIRLQERQSPKAPNGANGIPDATASQKPSEPNVEQASSSLRRKSTRPRPSTGATATGSPATNPFAKRDRLRRSGNGAAEATPERKPSTPPGQVTPNLASERPTTPGKTPPSSAVAMRKTTPKKLFQEEIKAHRGPDVATPSLFRKDTADGQQTPNIVLAPASATSRRRSLFDSEQVQAGSPKMAAILDRRASIADNIDVFAPQGPTRGVKFEDPRAMEAEVSRERDEDQRRESGQFIMEQEADGDADEENATQNLKDMLQSMTPKKSTNSNRLKGRKSLAVGSAKGLLGKRPAELDDEEEEDSPRTFGKPTSPVKRIRLQAPPSAEDTMRSSRNGGQPLSATSGNARPQTPNTGSSPGMQKATTPKSQGRFKDAESLPSARKPVPTMGQTAPSDAENGVKDTNDEQIALQEFLNLTNIRFMELTTTKRRPTLAPTASKDGEGVGEDGAEGSAKHFEDSVVAGACTIPMLELFQHSCRELKKYISEGRGVVKEIEAETLGENPPVFKEYITASPADRAAFDNQFKNMKTSARLLSKATWYEWRMKLLEGVRESLKDTSQGLQDDDQALQKQLSVIEEALENGRDQHSALEREHGILQERADELVGCDPEDLETARERLQTVGQDIETQSHTLEGHLESISELDREIAAAKQTRQAAQAETKEARRQREECRGWSAAEVQKVQARVDDLVASSGWRIVAASGSQLTLEMNGELTLSFNIAAYLPVAASSSKDTAASPALSLAYSPKDQTDPSTTQRFFLQLLRAHLHSLTPSATHASSLLRAVTSGWELAQLAEAELKHLRRRCGITSEQITGDEKLVIETSVLLPESQSKVSVSFAIAAAARGEDIETGVGAAGVVAYGKAFNKADMDKVLGKKLNGDLRAAEGRSGGWAGSVEALRVWLGKH